MVLNNSLSGEASFNEPFLLVADLAVHIDGVALLKKVDFHVSAGEIVSIVGPNGAGKTTLLKAVAEQSRPHAMRVNGDVSIEGKSGSDWMAIERAKRVAVLPQFSRLNFPFLVEQVIALGRTPHATGKAQDQEVVAEVARMMDVSHLLGRMYTQLSGGEKQRVQLARVITQLYLPPTDQQSNIQARLLLLDEPMSSLDLGHQQQVLQAIKQFARQHVAVLMVMHDVNLAAQYSDRMLALHEGQILAQGGVVDVLDTDVLKTLYGRDFHILQHPVTNRPVVI